jgi:signal transduction histidine kinase
MSAGGALGRRSALETWAGAFEPEMRSTRFWGPTIAVSSAATLALVAILSLAPGLREFFALRPALPLALLAARAAGYFVLGRFERRFGGSPGFFALGAFSMGLAFQLVMSSLVVSSEAPGAFVLAVLPVVGAGYFCMVLRATPRFPWPALVQGLGMALALALRPRSPYVEIFAVAGLLAVGGGLFIGMLGDTMASAREALAEHRRAIEAHSLEERTGEARRLSSSLLELLQHSHDASSAISAALLVADHLADLVRKDGGARSAQVEAAVTSLYGSLRRVGHLLGASDDVDAGAAAAPEPDGAAVVPALRAALAHSAQRFPAVRIELKSLSRAAHEAEVALTGGTEELEQLLAELLKNACEGTGALRARRVTVSVDAESDPSQVAMRIADDGPGFPPHVLVATPTAFVTTKRGGSGLGLYTAERLVSANGGSLELENPPDGGGAVTLRLRRR